jgi:acyl carrier protein
VNNETLTSEKFIPDPFVKGVRLYRTGDKGRWQRDGNLDFLGRLDDQVKVRGFRIETGEIVHALQGHPGVRGAEVLAVADRTGSLELVAYLLADASLDIRSVRSYLSDRLPAYMLPSHYVQLEAFPLTASGKTDRRSLPAPDRDESITEYVGPRNETEEKLVAIWQDILGRERISIRDNFFDIGGQSIRAVQLIARINTTFLIRLSMEDVFGEATIENLAAQISVILDQNKQKKNRENLIGIEL